jgi:hypothetical protein
MSLERPRLAQSKSSAEEPLSTAFRTLTGPVLKGSKGADLARSPNRPATTTLCAKRTFGELRCPSALGRKRSNGFFAPCERAWIEAVEAKRSGRRLMPKIDCGKSESELGSLYEEFPTPLASPPGFRSGEIHREKSY